MKEAMKYDEDLLRKVINLIVTNCNLEEADLALKGESRLSELGINSIDYIKIVVAIEIEFGFEFEDNKLTAENFSTVSDLCSYIAGRVTE